MKRLALLFPGMALLWAQIGSATAEQAPGAASPARLPEGVTARDTFFYSEGVQCYARLFLPKGFSDQSAAPVVVLAPGWGETEASIDKFGARFASRGLVAMAIDYRGWGKSGGFVYPFDPVRWDDRLRFSQHTAKVQVRRKRLIPQHQILDIRNAISYVQGEPGVDRARVGVWGTDMAGGHVISIAAIDTRVKAGVAQVPVIEGKEVPKKALALPRDLLAAEIRRARTGQGVAAAGGGTGADAETKLALAEYHPFWSVEQAPQTTAILFVVAEKDTTVNNEANAIAASKLLKGPTNVVTVPEATHALSTPRAFETAADAAAEWFLKNL